MVDVTLLELNLEDAEFTANAPFSGKETSSGGGSKVSKMLKRGRSGSDDDTGSGETDDGSEGGVEVDIEDEEDRSPSLAPLLVLGVIAVLFAVLRKRRRGRGAGDQQELAEYEA